MKLNVACNWDIRLPSILSKYKEVKMLFGNTGNNEIGGGRMRKVIAPVTDKDVEDFIRECHNNNLLFQYLVTAPSLGNREFAKEERKKILNFIGWLQEIGVDSVSAGNPLLIALIKKHFPSLPIKGSIFLDINGFRQAKAYEEMGLTSIVLPFYYSRDFKYLKKLRQEIHIDIQLFVNNTCVNFCPYSTGHANALGHGSQSYFYKNQEDQVIIDCCTLHCRRKVIDSPEELIKINWIRPEDITIYEEIGYEWFKITDRSASTATLEKCVAAYVNRTSPANLWEIMSVKAPLANINRFSESTVEANKKLLFNKKLRPEQRMFMGIEVYSEAEPKVDSSILEGIIHKIENIDCRRSVCSECGICSGIAQQAVHVSMRQEELGQKIEDTLNMFYHSHQELSSNRN